MLIPDDQVAAIVAQAGGNRAASMIGSALELAKRLRRTRMDDEIAASVRASDAADSAVYNEWEGTSFDRYSRDLTKLK